MTPRPKPLARQLLPALLLTSGAAGLITLLDHPADGAAGGLSPSAAPTDSVTSSAGRTALPATPLPTTSAAPAQPAPVEPLPVAPVEVPAATAPLPELTLPAAVEPAAAPAATTPAAPTSAKCTGTSITGSQIDTRYGPVQVKAVVSSSGKWCSVRVLQSPTAERKSVAINANALPVLHDQAISARGANINGVSGATYTSRAYARSLQSIVDQGG